MPKLRINNLSEQVLVFDRNLYSLGRKEEKFFDITVAKMEALRPKLVRMQDAGIIEFNYINFEPDSDDDAEFMTLAGINAKTGGGGVPATRNLAAGAGLTGGGDLSADRTFNVVAHADGSIVITPDSVQLGIMATDVQHGNRGGGPQHAVATLLANGFMFFGDKVKLDNYPAVPPASTLIWGDNSVATSTTTRYLTPGYDDGIAETSPTQILAPRSGTLRNMRVLHNGTSGNGNPIVYTLRINGVASALSVSLASTAAVGSDLVSTVAVLAGDRIDVEITKAASVGSSPSNVTLSIEYV